MENDESQLLHQLAQGDQRALQRLFDLHYVSLCRTGLRLVHRPEIVEELVQDVFIYLWEKREHLQISSSLPAYLSRAVRNRCLNHLKSRAAQYDWATPPDAYQPATDASPIEHLQFAELHEVLEQAVQKLPKKCLLVYSLSRYEELTYREIAEQLGVSIKTVEYYMGQALKHLRAYLGPYGYAWILFVNFF